MTATDQLIELAERLQATDLIGGRGIAQFRDLAARARLEQVPQAKLDAADRIRLAAAAEALRPFAVCVQQIDAAEPDEEWAKFRLLISDYRRAAAAYEALRG